MRMRVAAQAFTIAAVCAYCWRPGKDTGGQTPEAMSTSPLATPHTPSLRRSTESYGERALRKLKEEPLVPIGASSPFPLPNHS
jgi:hypothetical protein